MDSQQSRKCQSKEREREGGRVLGEGFGYGVYRVEGFCKEDRDLEDGSFLMCISRSVNAYVFVTFLLVIVIVNSLGTFAFAGLSGKTSLMSYIVSSVRTRKYREPVPIPSHWECFYKPVSLCSINAKRGYGIWILASSTLS